MVEFKATVLCVDDEPEILSSLKELVLAAGYEPITAANAEDALVLLRPRRHEIALVISDLKMPGKSGFELRQAMLPDDQTIPFILLSGHVTREMALQAVERRISAFVDKPFERDEMIKLVQAEAQVRAAALREESELLAGFEQDCVNLLEEYEELVQLLQANPRDSEALNRIFGIIHTIKGASGFFKPDFVNRFAHRFEDRLAVFKNGGRLPTNLTGILLAGGDILRTLIVSLCKRDHQVFDTAELLDRCGFDAAGSESRPDLDVPQLGVLKKEERAELRISTEVLDQFMELSGEITVLRNSVKKITKNIEKAFPGNREILLLSDLLEQMSKINTQMQDRISDIRKLPLKNVFRPLHRMIRDLSSGLGKSLRLATAGDTLRIDHTLADALSSSLVHMIRNSADHGIEGAQERARRGKPPEGTVSIRAEQRADNILLEVSDDGRGIDVEVIRNLAVKKGVISETAARTLDEARVLDLIFAPGFSTSQSVTDISGRGVGMDMVKRSIEKLNGKVEIRTKIGEGTQFQIQLPIPRSVQIVSSLLVEAGGETFAISQEHIARILSISKDQSIEAVQSVEGGQVLRWAGGLLPLISLASRLKLSSHIVRDSTNIVVVKTNKALYGVLVDSIVDIEDIVVKRFLRDTSENNLFWGATFLGDGHIGLILDLDALGVDCRTTPGQSSGEKIGNRSQSVSAPWKDQRYLLFRLDAPGNYCVRLQDVFRIEGLNQSQIKGVGHEQALLYRGEIVPLVSMEQFVAGSTHLERTENFQVVIVRIEGRPAAFAVREILDIAYPDRFFEESYAGRAAVRNTILVGEKSAAVIDFSVVLAESLKASRSRSSGKRREEGIAEKL